MFKNLGLLGLNIFLSFFEISAGREYFDERLDQIGKYSFYGSDIVASSKNLYLEKSKNKEDRFLSLKIFADKQYDYDQNIYLAEGNVRVIVNGGILRSDLLRYEKSTGTLSAEGNVRFIKGAQYIRAKEFRFNLLNKEGIIKDSYGILDIKNLFEDFKVDSNSKKLLLENKSINELNNNRKNSYYDGIEFSFGNIKLPKTNITRINKSVGSINYWRFKSDEITISGNHWQSNKITFTNDPFDPNQIAFEGEDVIAEEEDGELLITSAKTNLIFEGRNKTFLGKRIFGGKKKENKYDLMFDNKDRDGLVINRRSDNTIINNNMKVNFQPQFLINRAILGIINSYESNQNKEINYADLFGIKIKLNANYKNWVFNSVNNLSSLNTTRIFSSLRHVSSFKRYFKMPFLDDASFNIFTTYRSRAWNGTFGETEIKSAYGGFIETTDYFRSGEVSNKLKLRIGTSKYEAEKLSNSEITSLLRSSIFASLDSEYEIWKWNVNNPDRNKENSFSPVFINPELSLRSNINSAYFKYEEGSDQAFIKFSLGPEIRLGKFERNFLDFTKISIMPGIKLKAGNSPFKFDNAIDLKMLNISFMQQIYGPLVFDFISNINIDNESKNYGEYYDNKLGLLWNKRAYEFGIYYHPDNEAGGLYFRINGFNLDNAVREVF